MVVGLGRRRSGWSGFVHGCQRLNIEALIVRIAHREINLEDF